jgi:hypothetical protein
MEREYFQPDGHQLEQTREWLVVEGLVLWEYE